MSRWVWLTPAIVTIYTRLCRCADGTCTLAQDGDAQIPSGALEALAGVGIRVAVGIDGDAASHDRHCRRPDGSASHVLRARPASTTTPGRARLDLSTPTTDTWN